VIVSDLYLARRLERQEAVGGARFIEARGRVSPEVGAEWIEVAGTYVMFDGPASPLTQTFGLGLYAEPTPADLDRIEAFFRERASPVCHEVSPLAGVPIADILCVRGYRPIEFTTVMYKALTPETSAADASGGVITRLLVKGEEELWSQVSARGWAEQPEYSEFLLSFGRMVAATEGSLNFFAHLDGTPIATGVLRCHEGVAYFGGASTVPEARKHGAQGALLKARMNFAIGHGCDLAMMCAHPGSASQRNAERQGFRIAYTRTKWQLSFPELGSR
jgi:hypothetical protein